MTQENVVNEYDAQDDFAKSLDVAYQAIRERVANGGLTWNPEDKFTMTQENVVKLEKVKPAESSHDKFVRLAEYRMSRLVGAFRRVGNCSAYDFTAAEQEKIVTAVFKMANELKVKFETANKAGKRDHFSF